MVLYYLGIFCRDHFSYAFVSSRNSPLGEFVLKKEDKSILLNNYEQYLYIKTQGRDEIVEGKILGDHREVG